jgi:hypothetical protein
MMSHWWDGVVGSPKMILPTIFPVLPRFSSRLALMLTLEKSTTTSGPKTGTSGIAVPIAHGVPTAAGVFRPHIGRVVADHQVAAEVPDAVAGAGDPGECEFLAVGVRCGGDRHDFQVCVSWPSANVMLVGRGF